MNLPIPFQLIDWSQLAATTSPGEQGTASSLCMQFPGLRLRMVTYHPGYLADHWCQKGHVVHCLSGSVETQMEGGESHRLQAGMTYVVSDAMSSHRSYAENGAQLLIIDGDFLSAEQV